MLQKSKEEIKNYNERFDQHLQELKDIKSETIRLYDYTKFLKETTTRLYSKLIEQQKHISSLTTSFEELLYKINVSTIVGNKIDADKLEIETKQFNKFVDIRADNI